MTKKTVTVEFTIKKWQKMALLAIALLLMSYLMATCAQAQSAVSTVMTCNGNVCSTSPSTYYSSASGGVGGVTISSGSGLSSVSSDASMSHASIGSAAINTLTVGNCTYIDGSSCFVKTKPKSGDLTFFEFWKTFVSIILLVGFAIVGIQSYYHWYNKID